MKVYISKDNRGLFHICPRLNYAYNNWYKENDYLICRLCNVKAPEYLSFLFKIANRRPVSKDNELIIGNALCHFDPDELEKDKNFIKLWS